MDFTARLALNKPNPDPVTGDFVDVSKLNQNADTIDRVVSFTICTSTDRPATPFAGQAILETDTAKAYVWGGSDWLPLFIGNSYSISGNLGIGTAPDANVARRLKTFWAGTMGGTSQVLIEQSGVGAGSRALGIRAGGQDQWWADFDGKMQWAPPAGGGDTVLYRSAASTLRTDGAFIAGGAMTAQGRPVVTGPAGSSGRIHWWKGTVSTDASGLATVTHGAGFVPAAIGISQNGVTGSGVGHLLTINGTETSTTVQVKCMNASGGTAAVSVGVTLTCFA